MINIGLTGWGDHETLYTADTKPQDKLQDYSSHFPVVELDASFYAVQPIRNIEKWIKETPEKFQFVVKAYQGMTGHQRGESPFESKQAMFEAFKESIIPLQKTGKLATALFQFPPWFDCKKEHVQYIRYCKKQMGDIPVALEFRNQSWYSNSFREQTISFMKAEGWMHSIADEPQAGKGSVPFVPVSTHPDTTIIRLHGRNFHGWTRSGNENWREVRYLYDYNKEELFTLANEISQLNQSNHDVIVLFNNNSGGHAANNAKQLQEILGIDYQGLAPKQLDLF